MARFSESAAYRLEQAAAAQSFSDLASWVRCLYETAESGCIAAKIVVMFAVFGRLAVVS
jgi:hypothetical protein